MENPNTWTDLHYKIDNIAYSLYFQNKDSEIYLEVFNLLIENEYKVSLIELTKVINDWFIDCENGICGYSLPSQILNSFQKIK